MSVFCNKTANFVIKNATKNAISNPPKTPGINPGFYIVQTTAKTFYRNAAVTRDARSNEVFTLVFVLAAASAAASAAALVCAAATAEAFAFASELTAEVKICSASVLPSWALSCIVFLASAGMAPGRSSACKDGTTKDNIHAVKKIFELSFMPGPPLFWNYIVIFWLLPVFFPHAPRGMCKKHTGKTVWPHTPYTPLKNPGAPKATPGFL